MKELLPERAIEFAADLQYALYFEGRDLTDNEAYRHLLEKYKVSDDIFYDRLKSDEYKEKAYYDFALVKQLDVSGFPCVFIQTDERKLTMVARGYTDIETLRQRVESVLLTLH